MAYYVMEEMPDIHKVGKQVLYPRFAMIEQISTDQPQYVAESSFVLLLPTSYTNDPTYQIQALIFPGAMHIGYTSNKTPLYN